MRRAATSAALLLLLAVLGAGCGVGNPYTESTERTAGSEASAGRPRLPRPAADGEQSIPPTTAQQRPGWPREVAPGTPEEVARQVATLAGNWSNKTAPRTFAELAGVSVGDARTEFEQVAATAQTDVQETLGYDKSSATVVGVIVKGRGAVRHAIVVARQRISSPEIPDLPSEYKVTLVTLRSFPGGWAVSSWAPQP
jgi:hypothetical protein